MFRRAITLTSACLLTLMMTTSTIFAASSTTSQSTVANGLKISPVRTDLTIDPGKSVTLPVYITNATNSSTKLQVVIDNFVAKGQNGVPELILGNSNSYDPHGLKRFIAPIGDISLTPHQESFVNVKITIPTNTPGGGYYAAVRVAPATINATKNVTLSASVASLVLVKVPGPGLSQQVAISSFNVQKNNQAGRFFFGSNGLSAVVSFNNTGNVQEEPFGKVTVQNMSGKTILTKSINQVTPPGSVLPSSIRSFSVPLSGLGSFGKYTVSGYFGYGTSGQLLSASTVIYVVAPWIIVLIGVIIVLIIFGIWGMPKLFRYWYRRSINKNVANNK